MGSVFQRGRIWWVKYYREGKPYRESSGSNRKRDARTLLKKREGTIAEGTFSGLKPEKTTFDQLARDLLNDYTNNDRKALPMVRYYISRLREYFGGSTRACHITTDHVRSYIAKRKGEKSKVGKPPSNATINRELSALKRMLRLGLEAQKVISVPHISMLAENNVRRGFFTHHNYVRLKKVLPYYLKPIITLAYYSGIRTSELLSIAWDQVDFYHRVIRLNPGETKNDESRVLPMSEELYDELKAQRKLRDKKFPSCRKVFFNHSTGKPIKDFRGAWSSACKRIGLSNALFHDFRRTGVRNLTRAGVPEKIAMHISGHKTRSVFDRYNIVDEEDVSAAGRAVEAYLKGSRAQFGHNLVQFKEAREQLSHAK